MTRLSDDIPILDEDFVYANSSKRCRPRTIIATATICVLTIAGIVISVVMKPSKNNTKSQDEDAFVDALLNPPSILHNEEIEPKTDPEKDPILMSLLAIGDWGSTTGNIKQYNTKLFLTILGRTSQGQNPGSCCKLYKSGPKKGQVDTAQNRSET